MCAFNARGEVALRGAATGLERGCGIERLLVLRPGVHVVKVAGLGHQQHQQREHQGSSCAGYQGRVHANPDFVQLIVFNHKMKVMITFNLCCQIGQEGCLDLPHGEPASVETEGGDMLVRAPGLEPGTP